MRNSFRLTLPILLPLTNVWVKGQHCLLSLGYSSLGKQSAVTMLHSIGQQIWKTGQWPQYWKRSVFILIPKKGNAKECSNYHSVALISHFSKVMLKILQATFQQYMNWELLNVQARFTKGKRTKDQTASIPWIIDKAREFQRNIYFCFITLKPLTVNHNKLESSFKR